MRRPLLLMLAAAAFVLFIAACGGGGSSSPDDETSEGPAVRYAQQLCGPFGDFFDQAAVFLASLESADLELDIGTVLDALGELDEPLDEFRNDLEGLDPPDDLAEYHDGLLRQLDYAVDTLRAIDEGGLFAAFALPSPPPAPPEPEGLAIALAQECGEDLRALVSEFGAGFLAGGEQVSATPLPPGAIGEPIANDAYELLVHSVTDPYLESDELFEPEPGNRRVVVEVSITNLSGETQQYSSFDFSVKDAENFAYDAAFLDLQRALDSGTLLPDETIRGEIGFDVPDDAKLLRLTYDPGFFGEGRIDVELP